MSTTERSSRPDVAASRVATALLVADTDDTDRVGVDLRPKIRCFTSSAAADVLDDDTEQISPGPPGRFLPVAEPRRRVSKFCDPPTQRRATNDNDDHSKRTVPIATTLTNSPLSLLGQKLTAVNAVL